MSTALQLVNRVRRKHRFPDAGDVTDDLSVAILDEVNTAIETVLRERTWSFQKRRGTLRTQAKETLTLSASNSLTNGDATFSASGWTSGTTFEGAFERMFQATADAAYGNTAFLINDGVDVGTACGGELSEVWPGTTSTVGDAAIIYTYRYQLGSTVKAVTAAWFQEEEIPLAFVGDDDLRAAVPAIHSEFSDSPRLMVVGDLVSSTAESGGTPTQAYGVAIYPPTNSAIHIDYTYISAPAALSAATDTLDNTPRSVEDIICDLAYAKTLQTAVGNEPTTGVTLEGRTMAALGRRYAADSAAPNLSKPVRSPDRRMPVAAQKWPPRTVNTL